VAFSTTSGDPILLQSWDFGDSASGNLNSSSKNNPIHRFSGSGNYKVRLVALLACGLDTVEKEISIKLCEKPVCEIRIPNAITPNGDDRNDVFVPESNCAFSEYELSIYNRWGKLVHSGNRLADWPGSRNAADQDPHGAVYFYTLRWRFDGEAAQKKSGYFTLLR
jgi:gliding motility-associated-like protein